MPRFYIVGTKYAREEDMFPLMQQRGVVATGFAHETDLGAIVRKTEKEIDEQLEKIISTEEGAAKSALRKFLQMQPGDFVALKSHSAPNGKSPRLVIARYAVVSGKENPKYKRTDELGHTIAVDYLSEQEPIELPFGYGKTVHEVTDPEWIKAIFGKLAEIAKAEESQTEQNDKATHQTNIESRGAYIMRRLHNELQNELRRRLIEIHGQGCVHQERNFIDLSVSLPNEFILVEVKASPSPTYCIREAIGQMFFYAWREKIKQPQIHYIVVGPNEMGQDDEAYLKFTQKSTHQKISYITPAQYRHE